MGENEFWVTVWKIIGTSIVSLALVVAISVPINTTIESRAQVEIARAASDKSHEEAIKASHEEAAKMWERMPQPKPEAK